MRKAWWHVTAAVPAVVLLAVLVPACATAQAAESLHPDVVYVGGTVVTMDPAGRTVEAVAVRGDRILMTGSRAEVEALVGRRTRVVDLAGRTLVPGFYAPHDHFPDAGRVAL